jgi:serine/threonine-protein phosphatase 2A regulatory subunit B'
MLIISKDPSLSIPLIEALLRYWPFANSQKETLFILEISENF